MVKNLSNQVPGSAPKSAHCRFHQILHKAQKCRSTPCNTGIGSASEISAGLGLEPHFHSEINFAKMQIETARQAERELREQLKIERAQKDGELSSYRQRANSGADALAVLRLEFAELKGAHAGMAMRCAELQSLLKEPLKQRVRPAPLRVGGSRRVKTRQR